MLVRPMVMLCADTLSRAELKVDQRSRVAPLLMVSPPEVLFFELAAATLFFKDSVWLGDIDTHGVGSCCACH